MFYNEAYEERKALEDALVKKWHKALEVNNISDEHTARTTAILLENYLEHLESTPQLIAEDQIQTGAFTGVNLALLGLIARAIPQLVGLELVGVQAMPTPRSPIFTLRWYKSDQKGGTGAHEEMWVSPTPAQYPVGIDPYYTSSQIRGEAVTMAAATYNTVWGSKVNSRGNLPLLFANTVYVTAYAADGTILTIHAFAGDYNNTTFDIAGVPVGAYPAFDAGKSLGFKYNGGARQLYTSSGNFNALLVGTVAVASIKIDYDYKPEDEPAIPEMTFEISQDYVDLIRRQLRGNYTLDAAYDLKKLHGIDLETAIMDMMKQELMAEINREIINDLRLLANIHKTLDLSVLPAGNPGAASQVSINANYNDAHLVMLDAIEKICAEIWNIGRRGYGNFVVGNPATLSFLDRVPGFVGSGVSYTGRDLNFAGTLGGKIKFYHDPQYPKNELLIGYKGTSAIDSGYVYCPYLPITTTPTLLDPMTGNPRKLYYTRYGKTFQDRGNNGMPKNLILMGEYQYARLTISGLPTLFQ